MSQRKKEGKKVEHVVQMIEIDLELENSNKKVRTGKVSKITKSGRSFPNFSRLQKLYNGGRSLLPSFNKVADVNLR